jgi:hypothetical protein
MLLPLSIDEQDRFRLSGQFRLIKETNNAPLISILETGVTGTCFPGKIGTNFKMMREADIVMAQSR